MSNTIDGFVLSKLQTAHQSHHGVSHSAIFNSNYSADTEGSEYYRLTYFVLMPQVAALGLRSMVLSCIRSELLPAPYNNCKYRPINHK